ncbi:hypothetical protein [Actinacidiphila acididurans]|uniref:Peptidase MA-like domain-containing protein n=1 Tax=Actinacidiphila acididurans TaxID=2784346 RepID=A0ABS2TQ44_9ACTN|nr:hypothetical protein [Actinacidiphila acididurans]MBM9505450.1 hypothetical protein [Actinacidiphila acididurans]
MAAVLVRRFRAAAGMWAAGLAVLAALAGGCTSAAAPAAPSAGTAVRQVLDRHAAAVLHHDRAAFLAGVDPQARTFLAAQQRVFADLADVPLAAWSYTLVRTGAFPLPPAADGTPHTAAEVQLRYRLAGYDTQPVVSTAYLTFARHGGTWYLAADDEGAPSGRHTAVQLWDQGPVRVVRGAHSIVLGLAPDAVLRGYAADADRAVPEVSHAWGSGWPGKVVIEAPASLDQMAALLDAAPNAYQGIAAVTTGELGRNAQAPADRVIVNPAAFGELSDFGRQVVLTHETTHVASRLATNGRTPLWLSEGLADWVAYRDSGRTARQIAPELAADVAAGRVPTALPTAADFRPTAKNIAQAYEGGWLACRLIADQWSPDTLTAFYRAVAKGGSLDSVMRNSLGLGLADFTARWRDEIRGELA